MKLIVIGNGVAGVTTARFVAERDPSADVSIYSDEPFLYYPRPRLIDLLAARVSLEDMPFYPEQWYQQRNIHMTLNCPVRHIDPAAHCITLASGATCTYDQLVLATGAHAWVPPVPGTNLQGVFTLRSLEDALALRDVARQSKHAVILGGGLLGLDTAAALRTHGINVTVVELLPRLLPRQLDHEGAQLLENILCQKGIEIITSSSCTAIQGQSHVETVHLQSGGVLEADLVVVSAGVRPNMALAQACKLSCNRGVVVDEHLKTSDPAIYAVGDAAEFQTRVWGIIPAALAQARVAAAQIVGQTETVYEDIVPSTTLKVTGIDLTSIGEVTPEKDGYIEVRKMDPGAQAYKKLVIRNDRVVGAIILGSRSSLRPIIQLIDHQTPVSAHLDVLLNEGFDRAEVQRLQRA